MNLVEESFKTKKVDKNKKIARIVLVIIIILIFAIIGIVAYIAYLDSTALKVSLNGKANQNIVQLLHFEDDGTIYVPIKRIASYFGYQSYNGEYSNRSEDASKCYVQGEKEIANFELNSNKIYKLDISSSSDNYEYFYTTKPVKAINGELCITTEGLQEAFNISFSYNRDTNRVQIYTMPYLISSWEKQDLNYGYNEISKTFVNQKAILASSGSMLIVRKGNYYGVIETNTGKEILEPKYSSITYLPYTEDFLVVSNRKTGVISRNKETKIDLLYDSIELMDIDAGLYLVKRDGKYGVIDTKGNTKIYAEYDAIGIDISKFEKNNIKNKYILVDNLIPIEKDGKWGLFDKNGNQLVDFTYDSFGYIASTNKDALNLLVIPGYNVMVACKDGKYTLINSSGQQPFSAFVDDIYLVISSNQEHYYMRANDKTYDVEEYLDRIGVRNTNEAASSNTTSTNTSSNTTSNITSNTSSTNTTGNTTQNNAE